MTARMLRAEMESLRAENERLQQALRDIGLDCRYESNDLRCARNKERSEWCGGCVAWAALEGGF